MTDTQPLVRPATDVRRAWTLGGGLLIAAPLFGLVWWPGLLPGGIVGLIGTALLSAALLVFALGIGGTGSVTARRPLGTGALVALAVWVLASQLVWNVLGGSNIFPEFSPQLLYVDVLIHFVAALIAVIQIARAGVVPRPWNWAPAWVVGAAAVVWLVSQLLLVNVGGGRGPAPDSQAFALFLGSIDASVRVAGPVFLGVVAILLGDRSARTVMSESR